MKKVLPLFCRSAATLVVVVSLAAQSIASDRPNVGGDHDGQPWGMDARLLRQRRHSHTEHRSFGT